MFLPRGAKIAAKIKLGKVKGYLPATLTVETYLPDIKYLLLGCGDEGKEDLFEKAIMMDEGSRIESTFDQIEWLDCVDLTWFGRTYALKTTPGIYDHRLTDYRKLVLEEAEHYRANHAVSIRDVTIIVSSKIDNLSDDIRKLIISE